MQLITPKVKLLLTFLTSNLQNPPLKTYAAAGTYSVNLTVTTVGGVSSTSNVNNVTVYPGATITPITSLNVCAGSTITLTGSGTVAVSSPWVSATPTVATIGTATSQNIVINGVSAGTSVITYTNTNGCTVTATVTVSAVPTITGTLSVCVGSTTQLTGSATAATLNPWVSATTGVATVSNTGLVTGVSFGTSVITYTNSVGCTVTATVTVNTAPAAITITPALPLLPVIKTDLVVTAGLTTNIGSFIIL